MAELKGRSASEKHPGTEMGPAYGQGFQVKTLPPACPTQVQVAQQLYERMMGKSLNGEGFWGQLAPSSTELGGDSHTVP